MSLTTAQENAHLRLIVARLFDRREEALPWFLAACRAHARDGGADEREAADTLARLAFGRVKGRALTPADVHELTNHRTEVEL